MVDGVRRAASRFAPSLAGVLGFAGARVAVMGVGAIRSAGAPVRAGAGGAGETEDGCGADGGSAVDASGIAARFTLSPAGGATTSGSEEVEKTRATASSPLMLLRTRFGSRPIGLGAPRSEALHAPGRAPRRPRISVSASAPPASGIGSMARRTASSASPPAPGDDWEDEGAAASGGDVAGAVSSGAAVRATSGDSWMADRRAALLVDVGLEPDAGDSEFRSCRRAAGVDSSTSARRRVGVPDDEAPEEGVTVTDCERT